MHTVTITFISFGLAMDAFAASISRGVTATKVSWRNSLITAILFGSFQAFMPLIGWYSGSIAEDIIVNVDHWVAFGLLFIIGIHMGYEGLSPDKKELGPKAEKADIEVFSLTTLLILAIATSIDALATGISFSCLQVKIFFPALLIGIVTFTFSLFGVRIGKQCEGMLGQKAKVIGGIILIGIGAKILVTHLGLFALT